MQLNEKTTQNANDKPFYKGFSATSGAILSIIFFLFLLCSFCVFATGAMNSYNEYIEPSDVYQK